MCVAGRNHENFTKKPSFGGSVIDVDKSKKTHHQCMCLCAACLYLSATDFTLNEPIAAKQCLFCGVTSIWCSRSRGIPSPRGTKFCHNKLESSGQPAVKISWF